MINRRTDIDRGIKQLHRRIEEVEGLNPSKVRWNDDSVRRVASDISVTLSDVFGKDSQEHKANRLLLFPSGLHMKITPNAKKPSPEGLLTRSRD